MTNKAIYKYGAVIVLGAAIASLLAYNSFASADLNAFAPTNCYTAAATSTLTYMTPGTATTTVTCKLGVDGANMATLMVLVNASSTGSVFKVYTEESMDGQDWFPTASQQQSSTTPSFGAATRAYTVFQFASTTIGGTGVTASLNRLGVNGTNNRNHYTFDIPVRMRQVRAYITLTGKNAGVWMKIVPRSAVN